MYKKGQIVQVVNPKYSTYGMIGRVEQNYKIKMVTTKIVQYGIDYITNIYPNDGYSDDDDIYVSFDKYIGDTNSGIFSQKDLKIMIDI